MKTKIIFIVTLSLILSSTITMAGTTGNGNLNVVDLFGVQMPDAEYKMLKAINTGCATTPILTTMPSLLPGFSIFLKVQAIQPG